MVVTLLKSLKQYYIVPVTAILLVLTLCLGVLIRTPHLSALGGTAVLDPDSARYLRQAEIILERGQLPSTDMLRQYPIGKDSETQLSVYPYTLTILHKGVSLLFRSVTLEQIGMFSSLFFFSLSLIVFYLLLHRLLGWQTALLSINLCVVVPSTLGRSVVGNVDRDAFCLFLALVSYYLYLHAHQSNLLRNRLVLGLLSGAVMTLLGLTWQGVGLFISIIVLLNFILFLLPSYHRSDFYLYLAWFSPVILGLLSLKAVYRDLSQAHTMLAVALPCGFLLIVLLFMSVSKHAKLSELCTFKGKIPLSFAVTTVAMAVGSLGLFLFSPSAFELIHRAWAHFQAPFGSGRLAASIEELQKRGAMGWFIWPGYFFFFIVAGALLLMKKIVQAAQMNLWLSLTFFQLLLAGTILTRFVSIKDSAYESPLMIALYASSLIVFSIGMVAVYLWGYHKQRRTPSESSPDIGDLFLLASFCILLFISRGAMRFEFFFAPVAMALGCYTIVRVLSALKVPNRGYIGIIAALLIFEFYAVGKQVVGLSSPESYYDSSVMLLLPLITSIGIAIIAIRRAFGRLDKTRIPHFSIVTVIVFLLLLMGGTAPFPWLGGYAALSYAKASEVRPTINPSTSRALGWFKRNTPQSSVIAAWWDYGSFINLLSKRATITDEEQLSYWVHLMAREALFAETDLQALRFLKAHGATHLLITERELRNFEGISRLASAQELDRYSFLVQCPTTREIIQSRQGGTIFAYAPETINKFMNEPLAITGETYPAGAWKLNKVYLKLEGPNGNTDELLGILIEVQIEDKTIRLKPEEFYYKGITYQQAGEGMLPCTLLISAHTDNPLDWEIFCLSPRVRNTLMIRLYLLNQASDYFHPIYPTEIENKQVDLEISDFSARIWEIHYPDNLSIDPKYLETDFPDAELRRLWKK